MAPSLFFAALNEIQIAHIAGSVLVIVLILWLLVIACGSTERAMKKKKGGQTTKAVFSWIFVLIALVIGAGWAIGVMANMRLVTIDGVKEAWVDRSSADRAVTISVPASWQRPHELGASQIEYRGRDGKGLVDVYVTDKVDFTGDLDGFAGFRSKELEHQLKSEPVEPPSSGSANGYPARFSRIRSDLGGSQTVALVCWLEAKGHFYTITFITPLDAEARLRPVAEEIWQNFRAQEGLADSVGPEKAAEVH